MFFEMAFGYLISIVLGAAAMALFIFILSLRKDIKFKINDSEKSKKDIEINELKKEIEELKKADMTKTTKK